MFQLPFAVVSGVVEALLVVYYPILVLAFMLLWYVVYRFLMRRRLTMLPAVGAPLSVYLHHPGQIIVVALVTFLACAGLWLLTSIPAVILGIANIQAATGVLYGDPLGMPDYMLWLTMGVFTLSSLILPRTLRPRFDGSNGGRAPVTTQTKQVNPYEKENPLHRPRRHTHPRA